MTRVVRSRTRLSTGNGEPLFLAHGKADAALADKGVEAVGQILDKFPGAGAFEGGDDLPLSGIFFGEKQVFPDGGVEEERILGDDPDVEAQVSEVD